MKQYISEEQWNELNRKQKLEFLGKHPKDEIEFVEPAMEEYPSIGIMIEFLGDDWIDVFTAEDTMAMNEVEDLNESLYVLIDNAIKNPCDELWQAVKNKLCQN